ncbi:MAG: peptidase M3, partial [Muribaculum sp.]|nr:peptidase M3 [Muribaculum sp.]
MKKALYVTLALVAIAVAALVVKFKLMNDNRQNPFIAGYTTPYEIPPFEEIEISDYMPALQAGIEEQNRNIEAIVNNPDAPTFENTIVALDHSAPILERVCYVFMALDESNSTPEMTAVGEKFYPAYTAHSSEVNMNPALFSRIKTLYENMDSAEYDNSQRLAIEKAYKGMVRNGALLDDAGKAELKEINGRLSDLYQKFNKNLLSATNAFEIKVNDEAELAGLPQSVVAVAKEAATERGYGDGTYVFTLHAPSRLPVLQYAENRDLREKMYKGYTSLASSGEYNNYPVIAEILKNRIRKAELLGYDNYAAYQTEKVMAKTVDNAEDLLMQIWRPAIAKVAEEVAEMQELSDKEGNNYTIEPWDYYYLAEKVRKAKYDLDEDEVRQYFPVDNVRDGIFNMANRLYGVTFTEMPDAPKY